MQVPIFTNRFTPKPFAPVVESYGQPQADRGAAAPEPVNVNGGAYAIGAVYLFFLFSHATEFIDTRGRLHLVVFAAIGAMIAAVQAGKLPSMLSSKAGICLSLFTMFLILSIPFSSWKGGSFHSFMDSWSKSYIAFFLVGGLVFTIQQMRKSLFLLGLGTIGTIYFSFKATKMNDDGRMAVEYGSLGNSNDLAGALLTGLPFLLYIMFDKRRSAFVRIICFPLACVLMLVVFKTGSRSGLITIVVMVLLFFLRATAGNKLKMVVVCGVGAALLPLVAGNTLMARYKTMFKTDVDSNMSEDVASAVQSTQARRQLVYNAIELTLRHPIFGVGLGNFSNQSAELEISKGRPALWFTSHDIYLLVSSETGVVGIVLYMGTMLFTFGTLIRIGRAAKREGGMEEIEDMAACIFMALAAFAASGAFSTNAYTAQLPLFAGLTVAFDRIAKPILAAAEEKRFAQFRQSIPVKPSKYAASASSALALR